MAIDIFKAIQAAGVPSPVFQRQKAKPQSFVEMAASAPVAASPLFKFPGQTAAYAVPATVPAAQVAPGAPGAPAAAERAYQTEKARVAQMAAQNPELQRYEAARKIAAAKGATPEQVQSAEDIGMQMWAKANPQLAANVKPGQSGYDAIQGVLNAGAMGVPADLPFTPGALLGTNAMQTIPSYEGQSDLQPVGTPLPRTQFGTPENQVQAQMFNRFMSGPPQPPISAPPVNPAQATYEGATNVQPIGDISLSPFSFNTPAEKRRSELFQRLLTNISAGQ
jgi:hypothetical protein